MGLEDEVLEGALLNAYALLRRSMVARQVVADLELTIAGVYWQELQMISKVLADYEAHLRSCQWHGAVS